MLDRLHEKGTKAFFIWLRNMFLAGLAVALPMVVTVWIIGVVAGLFHEFSGPVLRFLASTINVVTGRRGADKLTAEDVTIPLFGDVNLLGLLMPVIIIGSLIGLGAMATNVIGGKIVSLIDRVLANIPFFNFIYKALRQVIDSFKSLGQTQNFKRVAFIEYPSPGCRLLGFVTGTYYDEERGKGVTSVFLPTSPNPMTGFIVVVDDEKVINSPMTLEEATKMILSAGLVAPGGGQAGIGTATTPLFTPGGDPAGAGAEPSEEPGDSGTDEEEAGDGLPAGLPVADDDDDLDPAAEGGTRDRGQAKKMKEPAPVGK